MRKRFRPIMATTWHKSFWRNICPLESSNLWPLFQSVITRKHEVPQSHILIIFIISSTCSLSSTTANIVIWKNILLSLHIKPGNKVSDLALMGHDNFVGFFLNNTFFSFLFSFFIFYLFFFYYYFLIGSDGPPYFSRIYWTTFIKIIFLQAWIFTRWFLHLNVAIYSRYQFFFWLWPNYRCQRNILRYSKGFW